MKIRYVVLLLLVLLSVVTYLDRIAIGVAASAIQEDLGISESAWGWVLGAFLLSYGLFEIPTGALGDRIGQRKVLTRIVLWWSAFTALTPLAVNYLMLVATRFLFGAGEAGAYPNASGCISRWFPPGERARAQGLIWGASRVGGALTPLLVVPLMRSLGWRACFWVFGGLGVVWAVVWAVWFRDDPAQHPAVGEEELREIAGDSTVVAAAAEEPAIDRAAVAARADLTPALPSSNPYKPPREAASLALPVPATSHANVPWRALMAKRQLWLIVAMYWFYVSGFIFFMFWLPKFLTSGRGLSQNAMAVAVALTFLAGALGNLVGGWASDRLSKRFGLAIGRKAIAVTSLTLSGLLLGAAAVTPGQWTVAAMLIACFGITDAMLPCSWAVCNDVGRQYSGVVSGAMNSAGQAAGYVFTVLYGYLIGPLGYDRPLLILAPNLLISALLFALIDPTRPLVPELPANDE